MGTSGSSGIVGRARGGDGYVGTCSVGARGTVRGAAARGPVDGHVVVRPVHLEIGPFVNTIL